MNGAVRIFADYTGDVHERADVVVVGSGPGGAVVAHGLAAAGHDVILVEEGPPFTPDDFELDGARSMARTLREGGLRATRGYMLSTMQAIALGGGSLVNSAICVRSPQETLDGWCSDFALERTTRADLDPHYDAVEKFLGIEPTPDDVQGDRNLLFRDGCNALGYSSEPIARNVRGCRGSGECFTGCRARAKQSMDISYVPAAIAAGARVLTSVQVQQVTTAGRRATGVAGQVARPFTGELSHRVRIEAKVVVLAAGCMATPVLLQRSGGLANASGQAGENLQFHPGVAIMGVFPERTHPEFGATQGYQSLQFIPEGFKLETLWAPPGVFAVRLPGIGTELKQRLAEIPYCAVWDAIASCNRSLGRVRARRRGMDPALHWRFDPQDVQILKRALQVLAELLFAAGARKILPGVGRLPEEMHSLDEAEALRRHDLRADDLTCGGNHAFSSTRMHGDPRRGVVGEDGRCHDLDNLYVADTGILPRSPAVNPMLTCMALAHRVAAGIAERI
ncbi:MAG: GMC family oxidoreductase [Deltaproteobacteria bacterium]|nr:GMC family oxidoreductase [Deltaproteobacteria bacterium]